MFAKQYSKPYHTSQEAQHKRSRNTLIGVSVHLADYRLSCDKMALHSRPFESVEFCLNRACTALPIFTLRQLLHLFETIHDHHHHHHHHHRISSAFHAMHRLDVLNAWGFGGNFFYGRMPFLMPTIVFFPGLGPAQWCAGLRTPRQSFVQDE